MPDPGSQRLERGRRRERENPWDPGYGCLGCKLEISTTLHCTWHTISKRTMSKSGLSALAFSLWISFSIASLIASLQDYNREMRKILSEKDAGKIHTQGIVYHSTGIFFWASFATAKLLQTCKDHFHLYSLSAVNIYDLYHMNSILLLAL